jgi:hypothetical protein
VVRASGRRFSSCSCSAHCRPAGAGFAGAEQAIEPRNNEDFVDGQGEIEEREPAFSFGRFSAKRQQRGQLGCPQSADPAEVKQQVALPRPRALAKRSGNEVAESPAVALTYDGVTMRLSILAVHNGSFSVAAASERANLRFVAGRGVKAVENCLQQFSVQ